MPAELKTRVLGEGELRPTIQRFHLVVLRGPEPGRSYPLRKPRVTVGKGEDNDIVIPDATVSRVHLEITEDGSTYILRDLESTNGTFLEEARIREAFLKPGARIRAGEVLLRFQPVSEAAEIADQREHFGRLISRSPRTREVFALLDRVAPTDATILLLGETGTGKSALARAIHEASARREGPFVVIDCGAISRSLIESELFGHEKGAFTGAVRTRLGAMEVCSQGTLFIDELDDMPLDVQPKLLRAIEEREIYRVGSHKPVKLDVRIVAASKKDLRHEVIEGRFREDLFYRLSVVMVPLPALRERTEDVEILVDFFLEQPGAFQALPTKTQQRLVGHTWPGNLRELRNVLERASYTGALEDIDLSQFRSVREESTAGGVGIDYLRPFKDAKEEVISRFEREYLKQLLKRSKGNLARAAREASIDRKYLYQLLKKYELVAQSGAGEE